MLHINRAGHDHLHSPSVPTLLLNSLQQLVWFTSHILWQSCRETVLSCRWVFLRTSRHNSSQHRLSRCRRLLSVHLQLRQCTRTQQRPPLLTDAHPHTVLHRPINNSTIRKSSTDGISQQKPSNTTHINRGRGNAYLFSIHPEILHNSAEELKYRYYRLWDCHGRLMALFIMEL